MGLSGHPVIRHFTAGMAETFLLFRPLKALAEMLPSRATETGKKASELVLCIYLVLEHTKTIVDLQAADWAE